MKTSSLMACAMTLVVNPLFAGSYIVKFKSIAEMESFSREKAGPEMEVLTKTIGAFGKVDNTDKSDLSFLAKHPGVEYIEENKIYKAFPVIENEMAEKSVDDNYFEKQWGLQNNGRNSGGWFSSGRAGEDISALNAWNTTTGSNDLIVAVIDTGVDYNHSDLKDNMLANLAELNGKPGIDDDGNGFVDDVYGYDFANNDGDPMDGNGHGTHCAGVIGASHNSNGIRGVLGNVKMIGVKFLSDNGSGKTEDAIKAIDYAISRGAKVLSNSWGGGEYSKALEDAIRAANAQGVIFVAAAGNSSVNNDTRNTYPANYQIDNVISVGSFNGKGNRSGFSNYGEKNVHVFAPGSRIYSTYPGDRYKNLSGTSMAAPFVSGAIGLLLSQTNMTPLEVREKVTQSAVKTSRLEGLSRSGRINAEELLK